MLHSSSIFSLVFQGDWISLTVLAILLFLSILSWGIILFKFFYLRKSIEQSNNFQRLFSKEKKMSDVISLLNHFPYSCTARQFEFAYQEFAKIHSKIAKDHSNFSEEERKMLSVRLERALEKSMVVIRSDLENHLSILATISSAAPFIGLFGTVLGIIDSFHSIGTQGVTSLSVVAPGISQALIATAFGLFAAIPALMGYNYFRSKIKILSNQMIAFSLELINKFTWIV